MDLSPTTSTVSVTIDINPAESLTLVVDDRTLVLPVAANVARQLGARAGRPLILGSSRQMTTPG